MSKPQPGQHRKGAADAGPRGSFPIAAIGVSAGGLAPTIELLCELGAQLRIGIVVIHHLDPTHESGLVEILSRATALPVAAATDGALVEPNRVYVVPPNADLLIDDGVLKVVPRLERGGLHLPIDRFCESLATDCDVLAVGVVLSGSGFDGTEGLKAIKREGGIGLGQDGTATFGSMPQRAIAAGCVDFIRAPLLVGEKRRAVTLEVIPFVAHPTQQRFMLVLFQDVTRSDDPPTQAPAAPTSDAREAAENAVREEPASTRQYLESVIEQLGATNEELTAANEEIVSSNEELRSTNEELQSAKEELQATNEELRTLNEEMRDRNIEATRLNDDLANVLTSIEIPILIVGRDVRLRRFTPAAGRVFGVLAADLGRPLTELPQVVAIAPALTPLVREVFERLRPAHCTIQDAGGRWHHLMVRPYVTLDGRIDGIVVTARDIDAETRASERLAAAQAYAESVVEAVRESLVVLDRDLRVRSTNAAFRRTFRLKAKDIEGRRLENLDRPELAHTELQRVLKELAQGATPEATRVEQRDEAAGVRVFLVNGRPIENSDLVLISLEDITEAERSRSERTELDIRGALTSAAEGILMVDAAGRIHFANHAAARLFGYDGGELVGVSVDLLLPDRLRDAALGPEDLLALPSPRPIGRTRDLVGRRKDGKEFPVEVSHSAMAREDGPVVVVFVTDVTERRRTEREILAYQEQLQRMAFEAVVTEERERRRIAIELHDWIGQGLALAKIKLDPVRGELVGAPRAAVDRAVQLIEKAMIDSRTLVFDLSPPVLYDLGLEEALAWLAEDVEKRRGFKIEVSDDGADKPLEDAANAIVFRAVRELLMNVVKHAQAPTATVSVRRIDDQLHVNVEDGGIGFDPSAPTSRTRRAGFGLLSVREQIARLGGTLQIESAPDHGTVVSISVPLQSGETAHRRVSALPPSGRGTS